MDLKKQCSLIAILLLFLVINGNTTGINGLLITWKGVTSPAWSIPGNWSSGTVPTENDDVLIPSGTPYSPTIINGEVASCNSIKINSGASFTVETGGVLRITNITPNGSVAGGASLITSEASLITYTSALLSGTIVNIGDCAVTKHGLAISTIHNPTISETTYDDVTVSGTGSYTIPVGSLLPATTYFVRAYATNCKGTTYGNEISFTTNGGSGDSGYFTLIFNGVTYFSYDLLDPLSTTTIFPEGDTRKAFATFDAGINVFSIASQSSFVLNSAKSFGYSFSCINPDATAEGIYTFGKANDAGTNAIAISIRTGTGASNAIAANYNSYLNTGNFARHLTDEDCEFSELTSANNTLTITKWGTPGQFIEGTVTGTLYENSKTGLACSNSTGKSFSVKFKLKRLQ